MPQPSATADGDDAVTRHEGSDGPSPAPDAPGDHPFRIGRYTILRRLGRGGMGVVYAAYDDKLDRKIALKLVYVSRERGTIGQARLLREAQALARLSHPNVVQVYEVGEHDRQVFLAMEFVSGVTLRAWARAARRPWREVLAVYHQAGRGLAAAHAVGLVHRDFKPDNALIADDPPPPVPSDSLRASTSLDTQDLSEPLTAAGLLLGTPAYMSPEQLLRSPTDARSDQYSFCVALWEALHGARPFRGRTLGELKLQVFGGPPRPPRGPVPARLARVLTRGLSVDPARRFPDMDALLAALADDPAQRRRRRLLAGITGLVLTGGGALGYALATPDPTAACDAPAALAGVWDPATRAAVQARFASLGLPFADQAFAHAAAQLDAYAARLLHLLQGTCEARERGLRRGRALELQVACGERARGELAALTLVLRDADARAVERVGQAVARLPAIEPCNEPASLLAAAAHDPELEDPALAARVRTQAPRLATARAELDAGHHERSRELAREIVAEAERLGHARLLADALILLGNAELASGDYPASGATLLRAYTIAESARHDRIATEAAVRLIYLHGERMHDLARAQTWAEVADAKLHRLGDDDPALRARLRFNVAMALLDAGQLQASELRFREVMALAEQRRDQDPSFYGIVLNSLATLEMDKGDLAAAEPLLRRSLALREAALGPEHPQVGVVLHNLALVLYHRREFVAAAALFRRALAVRERSLGSDHPATVETLNGLGAALSDAGDVPAGLEIYRRVLAIEERRRGLDHLDLFAPLNNLGNSLINARELPAAESYLERARVLLERHGKSDSADYALLLYNLSALAADQGALARAIVLSERSLALREAIFGPKHLEVGISLAYLADLERKAGHLAQAEAHALQAVAVLSEHPAGILELGRARVALASLRARDPHTRADARELARLAVLDLRSQSNDAAPLAEARQLLLDLSRGTAPR
ncbi:MAG: tetratricopeptide repeat protein [Myxococcales bacterium]|nr:tetratricopeptide repeat protein [Myxococcales bacterium]